MGTKNQKTEKETSQKICQITRRQKFWRKRGNYIKKAMASQTQGIQQLLSAEKKAAEKVSEARKRKNRRLKQAKEEAQTEIEKYKAERERAFKESEQKNIGSKDDIMAKIEADTKVKIEAMNRSVATNKATVIQGLLELATDIKPEVHKNYRQAA